MENKQYESPEITVISIEPDEKLMNTELIDDPTAGYGMGSGGIT